MNDEMLKNQQEIVKVEQHQEKLSNEKRVLEEKLLQLQDVLQRGFRQLAELNYEGVQQGHTSTKWVHKNNETKQHIFQRQLRQADEELNHTYNKAIQKLEIERWNGNSFFDKFYKVQNFFPYAIPIVLDNEPPRM
ncbi:hypothetical protein [Enterococcus mundtii]|uniref:hypothetical protein n=1 Tax=Enterococcus mundtii TaxID=53346 RepID=UPI001F499C1D|nr:hypothetical protein [Enterococcus mundtii]